MQPLGTSQVLSERLRQISKVPQVAEVPGLIAEVTWAADVAGRLEDANRQYQESALAIRATCEKRSCGVYKANDTDTPTTVMVHNTIALVDEVLTQVHTLPFWYRLRKAWRLLLGKPW